jgi:hypothetical protein
VTRAWIVVAMLAGGCRQLWGLGDTPGHSARDAPALDADDDGGPDAQACFGGMLQQTFCFPSVPTDDKSFQQPVQINTDSDPACEPSIASACVIGGATIAIGGTLSGTGSRALVLVAVDSLTITGTLDVASRISSHQVGAGSNPTGGCTLGNSMVGGGGAGGSFGGRGGDGGDGQQAGGIAGEAITLTTLRGGCPGGSGGGVVLADGGGGGGALYLYAGTQITVNGTIDASGGGGAGAQPGPTGGGGGGAGGLIVLDTAAVAATTGLIIASGAGGGEGSSTTIAGTNGSDPIDTNPANGGNGGSNGGRGGRGTGAGMLDGENGAMNNNQSGGGGGGGAGYIRSRVAFLAGKVQPPVTM